MVMSKSRKQLSIDEIVEDQSCFDLAQDTMHKALEHIYETHHSVVCSWMDIQLSTGEKTLEEIGLMLARNFYIAHSRSELVRIGAKLWEERQAEGFKDAA